MKKNNFQSRILNPGKLTFKQEDKIKTFQMCRTKSIYCSRASQKEKEGRWTRGEIGDCKVEGWLPCGTFSPELGSATGYLHLEIPYTFWKSSPSPSCALWESRRGRGKRGGEGERGVSYLQSPCKSHLGSAFAALVFTHTATRGQESPILPQIRAPRKSVLQKLMCWGSFCKIVDSANNHLLTHRGVTWGFGFIQSAPQSFIFHLRKRELFLISVYCVLCFGDMVSHQACDPGFTWPPLLGVTQLG